MIIACQRLLKNTKIVGITLFPFIIIRNPADRDNSVLINHEKIHLRQQAEMFIFLFYIWYYLEYLFRLLQVKNRDIAYRSISFEREAYAQENDLDYLKKKRFWSFIRYLK